jgi:hypothetical protein
LGETKAVHMNIVFTVCNRHTLANAIILADSVIENEPASIFYFGWVDNVPLPVLPQNVKVLDVKDVEISGFREMCARYYDFELVAACRPWFAKKILKLEPDLSKLTFLAPASLLLSSFGKLQNTDSELFLTPNITGPLKADGRLDDKRILNVGMFNSGAWTLRKTTATEKLLNWWSHRTIDRAKFDLCNGMCMDQLWLNFAPIWVPQTFLIKKPEWQYGLHSVLNHKLEFENEIYKVDGAELVSADFTGLANFDPVWSDHVSLISVNVIFEKLYKTYAQKVSAFDTGRNYENIPGYGIVSNISSKRLLRKKLVVKLKAISDFIENL